MKENQTWRVKAAQELAETLHLLLTGYFKRPEDLKARLSNITKQTKTIELKTGQLSGNYDSSD